MGAIGSASWFGAKEYEAGGPLHERATTFEAKVNWSAVTTAASRLRGNIDCSLSTEYSLGHFNLVRKVSFSDGVEWVVRLRLPTLEKVFGNRERLDVTRAMQGEVATTLYLRKHTKVPVPEIFGSDLTMDNEVGAPYVFMSYVHGTTAEELCQLKECPLDTFGTHEQDRKFREQVAQIQVELAGVRFNQIGRIYAERDSFYIGPDLETGLGPWDKPAEYYEDYIEHIVATSKAELPAEAQQSESFGLPNLFRSLMKIYGEPDHPGPFGLANLDFGSHNLLVDNEFNILALIDFDGILAAPIELIAQVPLFGFGQSEPPGIKESNPHFLARIKRTAPLFEQYVNILKAKEKQLGNAANGETPIGDCMLSTAASLVQGLREFGNHQQTSNDRWFTSFKTLLRDDGRDEL